MRSPLIVQNSLPMPLYVTLKTHDSHNPERYRPHPIVTTLGYHQQTERFIPLTLCNQYTASECDLSVIFWAANHASDRGCQPFSWRRCLWEVAIPGEVNATHHRFALEPRQQACMHSTEAARVDEINIRPFGYQWSVPVSIPKLYDSQEPRSYPVSSSTG